jgi:hypothetical protein
MPTRANDNVIDKANPAAPGSGGTACAATDQRDLARPVDGNDDGVARCDRGAVELSMPNLTINDATVAEGSSGAFTVTLYPESAYTVTVEYTTGDDTAVSGSDYVTVSGTLVFVPGETEKRIEVEAQDDTLDEQNEVFSVNLSAAESADIADSQGRGTITDDDPLPSLSIDDLTVKEPSSGSTDAVFEVTLVPASGREVEVYYNTDPGTATDGGDYGEAAGTLTFAAGETSQPITVTVWADALAEGEETFYVNLSGAINATLADDQGKGIILEEHPVYLPIVVRNKS